MTINSTAAASGPFIGTGALQTLPFDFHAASVDEIEVEVNGQSVLGYTVTLESDRTGSVSGVFAAGSSIYVQSAPSFTQDTDFSRFAPYFPDSINAPLDRAAIRDIALKDQVDRAIKAPVGGTTPTFTRDSYGVLLVQNGNLDFASPEVFKGNPGGNVMAIGPFAAASTMTIPVGADLIQTSGYASAGKGAARYGYDPTVDFAFVGANPRSSFLSANGRGFRLVETFVDVMMFGATGAASRLSPSQIAAETSAIRAAIAYIENTVDFVEHQTSSPANGCQNLFFPAGLYLIDDDLPITRSMSIYGDGHAETSSGSRIEQQTPGKDIFRVIPIAQGSSVSWTDLTLRANGGGGTGGSLIHISAGVGGSCNSVRIQRCFFFTPQTFAINVQRGDDYLITGCTFDISATTCLSFGSATATDKVTNVRLIDCDFYDIASKCILLYNVINMVIANNTVWHSDGGITGLFIDGYETVPYQIRNLSVRGNTFHQIQSIARLSTAKRVSISGNVGDALGAGAGTIWSVVELWGACEGVMVNDNSFTGHTGAYAFYDDQNAGVVLNGSVSGNAFSSNGGNEQTGPAVRAVRTQGTVTDNAAQGFATRSIGCRFTTTGNSVSPGTVAAGGSRYVEFPVIGAAQGDQVLFTRGGLTPIASDNFIVSAYIDTPNVATVRYWNKFGTDAEGVPGHDLSVLVTR